MRDPKGWLDYCLEQYNVRFSERRKYHQESAPEDCDPGEFVEFSEDGDAYPHGIGGTGHARAAVIPLRDFLES